MRLLIVVVMLAVGGCGFQPAESPLTTRADVDRVCAVLPADFVDALIIATEAERDVGTLAFEILASNLGACEATWPADLVFDCVLCSTRVVDFVYGE